MHLKSYPKLVRSELRLEAASVQTSPQRSGLLVSQQRALLKTRGSNHGNISGGRLPFSIISANMVSHGNTTNGVVSSNVMSLWLKASSSPTLQLPPPPLGCENNMLRLYQTTSGDADAPPDVWTVIKPGHVREKIAIFASEGGRTDGAEGSEQVSTSSSGGRDRTPAMYTNHTAMSGLTRAVKAKGSWEENCSAKRRRRSGSNQNQSLRQDQRTWVLDPQQNTHEPSPRCSDSPQRSGSGRWGGEAVTMAVTEEEEQKVSVVEMVAFLEQRASEQRLDCKPLLALQRSSTTITLCRAPPTEVTEGSDFRGEEPESIRVADMVAKLELDYLRRRTEGELSRSNSLRRTVGRVLLATGDQGSAPPHSPSSSVKSSVTTSSSVSSLPGAQSQDGEPISCSEMVRMEAPAQPLTMPPSPVLVTSPSSLSGEARGAGGGRGLAKPGSVRETETVALPPQPKEVEPVPGLLFLSLFRTCTEPPPPLTDSGPCPLHHRLLFDPEPAPLQPRPPAVSSSPDTGSQSEKRSSGQGDRGQEGQVGGSAPGSTAAPLGRRPSVSQDFLEMRQRLQQLLEPQQYLAVLPHHLLVKIFLLLPTQSLAALKCTCHYFKFVIENYGVRPADSLWVLDPRYRDDPCKQCKKRYNRGDVSLCRWHHKPYCQALPYGPGYWMCCHGTHRDTPGCNVGLHDNRWVPAFHSISVPIYRRSHDDD